MRLMPSEEGIVANSGPLVSDKDFVHLETASLDIQSQKSARRSPA
jgi:hypothetical protein